MILAPKNFRDAEFLVPRAFFEQAGVETKTVSTAREAVGRFGFRAKVDFFLENAPEADGIFFVGGIGSLDFAENPEAERLARKFADSGRATVAICAAPRNFLKWGILRGRKCSGNDWDGNFGKLCEEAGAEFLNRGVVADENFITGQSPENSEEIALETLTFLKKMRTSGG